MHGMKHLSLLASDKKSYKKAKKLAAHPHYTAQLIQVFCGVFKHKKIIDLLQQLHKDFPDAVVVGATTAGEISHAKMHEGGIVLSVSLFRSTRLKVAYAKQIDTASGEKIAHKILQKDTKAVVLLSEGLFGRDYTGFVEGLRRKDRNVIVAGGLAGDNVRLQKSLIFIGEKIYDKGAVAVSFSGKKLTAGNAYNLNWEAIGKEFTITKSHGKVVEKIDGISAVTFFERYLGEEIVRNNARALTDFQLVHKEGETVIARTPMAVDGQSIVFAAPVKEGEKFQFGFTHATSIMQESQRIAQRLAKQSLQGVFIYSCVARKILLDRTLEAEFEAFENIAPTAGFFTYGEFYSTSKNNALLNCTTTVLFLSEKRLKVKKVKTKTKKSYVVDLKDSTFSALSHFIQQTSKELDSNIKLMQQYQKAVDLSSIVSKTDTRGYISYVNDNFCQISGYTREELMGQPHNIIRHEAMPKEVFRKLWRTIRSGKTWQGRLSNKAKDGSIYYVDATIMPIFGHGGKIEEYIAVRHDVTKQVEIFQDLESKERLLQAMFDNQDNIVVLTTKGLGMTQVNQKFFEYFDFKNFEEFKENFGCVCELFMCESGYVNKESMPNWIDEISNNPHNDYKVKMKVKNGSIHTFSIRIKKIDDEYLINLNDITSLEKALVKAYASEQAKSMFLASMSHEIRTPLNGILGFTEVLAKHPLDSESRKYVDIIQKSGDILLQIVNDILDFSKIESGSLSLNKTPTNLFEAVQTSVSTFASLANNKQLNYYAYIDTRIPKLLLCDAQRIKQVLNNLISNAIKFTPPHGEVAVNVVLKKLKKKKATVTFSILDSGIGIPKQEIEKIFQPFSQADNSLAKEFTGTGLGLSISNQFVNMMGSNIEVSSTKSQGSAFHFTLEFEVLDPKTALLPSTTKGRSLALFEPLKKDVKGMQNQKPPAYKGRVIVAEDNETNQLLISVLLEARGVEYTIVSDGVELLEEIEKNGAYDLILMDINMPHLDGVRATKKLRKKGYTKPIVSFSANVIEADTQSYKEAGMDTTLTKPIDSAHLDALLHRYLTPIDREDISPDIPDPEALAQDLFLDIATVKQLFQSLKSSFLEIRQKIEAGKLDRALAHKIKGVAANMQLRNLAKYAKGVEFGIEDATQEQMQEFATKLLQYIDHTIEAIDQLG